MQSRFSSITLVQQGKQWLRQFTKYLQDIIHTLANAPQQIEVELKYAVAEFHQISQSLQPIYRQLSYQSAIQVNQSMKYQYKAGFPDYKKFLALKDLLLNICVQNQSKNQPCKPFNIYKRLSLTFQNPKLSLKDPELRLDINDCGTRYTYAYKKGWEVIVKKRLENFDLMYCGQTVRMSVSTERKIWDLEIGDKMRGIMDRVGSRGAAGEEKKKKDVPCLRLKNITKVEKNQHIELAMSEIVELDAMSRLPTLIDIADQPQALNSFLINQFANFYCYPRDNTKTCQVECQITSTGIEHIKSLIAQGRKGDFENFIERMLQEFCSLYHSDYCIKREEASVINEKYKEKNNGEEPKVQGRLENLVGNYMRSELLEFMRQP